MIWFALAGAFEITLPQGGEAVVNLVLENQTDTALKEPWIFVFSKPDWLSVSPDSVITSNLAKGDKVELQLKLRGEPSWFPGLREGDLRLRVLVRNGEVAPDFMDFKVKEEPAELASLVPFLLGREYEFEVELLHHYDYYPIIFLHGMGTSADYWNENHTKPYKEVMWALADFQHYDLYYSGHGIEPGDPIGSRLGYIHPKRIIYNFDYYIDWTGDANNPNRGAIGSNGTIYPCDDDLESKYRENLGPNEVNSYAKRLSHFIALVQEAAYTDKVHIVAHSMGGVVARAAIKWYGCNEKVNRLLMIGTPNHPIFPDAIGKMVFHFIKTDTSNPKWMKDGEMLELAHGFDFDEDYFNCANPDEYLEKLNTGDWAGGVRYGVIAGRLPAGGVHLDFLWLLDWEMYAKDDGLIDCEEVELAGADFFAKHLSAHGSGKSYDRHVLEYIPGHEEPLYFHVRQYFDAFGEFSLTSSRFTLECIRSWLIMDTLRNGDIKAEEVQVFVAPSPVRPGEVVSATIRISGSSARNFVSGQVVCRECDLAGRSKMVPYMIDGGKEIYSAGLSRRDGISSDNYIEVKADFTVPDDAAEYDYLSFIFYCYSMEGLKYRKMVSVPVVGR